jgi:hypothetical protein
MQDMDMVNVEFEWFDPQPAVDFHGLKTLLRQLLDVDGQLFDLSELADVILAQPLLGSTVKVDGNETDPYAFLTVLNLETHKVGNLCSKLAAPRSLVVFCRTRKSSRTSSSTSPKRRLALCPLPPPRSASS